MLEESREDPSVYHAIAIFLIEDYTDFCPAKRTKRYPISSRFCVGACYYLSMVRPTVMIADYGEVRERERSIAESQVGANLNQILRVLPLFNVSFIM